MSGMDDLVTWLTAQLDADAMVAREASRFHHDDTQMTDGGERWQWVDGDTDEVLTVDPVTDDWLTASLRSVEEYTTSSAYTLPHFVIHIAEEVQAIVAVHIARWDPARILAEVDAKRRIIAGHPPNPPRSAQGDFCQTCDVRGGGPYPCDTLRLLALPYADRPGYWGSWRP